MAMYMGLGHLAVSWALDTRANISWTPRHVYKPKTSKHLDMSMRPGPLWMIFGDVDLRLSMGPGTLWMKFGPVDPRLSMGPGPLWMPIGPVQCASSSCLWTRWMMINPAHFKPAIGPEHLGMPMGPGTPRDLHIYSRRQLNIENNGMGPCIHYVPNV